MTALAAALVTSGIFTVVVAQRARSARRVKDLRAVLEASYIEEDRPDGDRIRVLLARTGVAAERAFASTSFLSRLRATVARSDWKVNAGELLAICGVAGVVGVLVGVSARSLPLALLLGGAGFAGPVVMVNRSVSRRRRRFEAQFPDVLDLLASGLESGSAIGAALSLVVAEADEPAASEFARVLAATRLGSTLVDALADLAERLDSEDLAWTVQAITVQQRTGGRLADILRSVSEFMRGREELRREVQALTAEGRLSAYILGGLPFGLALFISVTNGDYLTPLFTTVPGLVMLAGAGALMAVAFVMMSRIVRIEV
ncbi:MAG TPA: type II secretion system F family protein [Acidimicrobiales bacterium]|nr:type II secretion system F family protein [Acidimicrobiales bacterium]